MTHIVHYCYHLHYRAIYGNLYLMQIVRLPEFLKWFESLDAKGKAQVDARILRIEDQHHFGDAKDLGLGLAELRWKNGRRVYFARGRDKTGQLVILILGGNKNGQNKDITQARFLLRKYAGNYP